ncbi:MAG: IS4 family transposase, partial [Planctomycetota bacterium]
LYEILQVLSLTLFEKTPLFQALQAEIDASKQDADRNQWKLFES